MIENLANFIIYPLFNPKKDQQDHVVGLTKFQQINYFYYLILVNNFKKWIVHNFDSSLGTLREMKDGMDYSKIEKSSCVKPVFSL